MRCRLLVACLTIVGIAIVGMSGAVGIAAADTPNTTDPTIHAVYPDPVLSGDRGEFVVLSVPNGTNLGPYSITDGHTTAAFPNTTVSGRVAVTADPGRVRNVTTYPVVTIPTPVALANSGDTVTVRRGNRSVSSVRYSESSEGEIGIVHGATIRWRPLGATDLPIRRADGGRMRAFTLPDAPHAPIAPLRNATERVFLAGYTLSSSRVASTLIDAHRRGADVRILLEGEPIGGRTRTEARTLDRLTEVGIEVRLIAGPLSRYRYHHAKYAVADDRAVVLTENWKPAGTGGQSSRGWGVVTSQPPIVTGLAQTFQEDSSWRDSSTWDTYRTGRRFQRGGPANGSYPARFETQTVPVERTELLVTPDNAQRALIGDIDNATEQIDVIQPTVGGWKEPLMRALRRAASRGVEVRLLISSAWYVREENQQTVERFNSWAERTDAPLSARLAEPSGRFGKIHAKGAIIDNNRVVVGSLNWNEQAATTNREVLIVVRGSEIASYFGRVFDADWSGGRRSIPVDLIGAVVGVGLVGALAARRVRFAQ
jgi:phosphatidylserine/phosphatidylglycerophosphate/cardiolipin synthase-like enzyme